MLATLRRLVQALTQACAQNAAAADELARENLRRLQWLALATLLINVLHVLAFRGTAPGDTATVALWKHSLLELHLGMAAVATVMGLAAWWLQRAAAAPRWLATLCGLLAFALALAFTATIAAVDQWVTPNIAPFLIGCMLVGVALQQRPLHAALLYLAAWVGFALLLGRTQADPALLLSNRVNGFTAALLGWVLATLSWRKTVQNLLLSRQLGQRQRELEDKQRELVHLAAHDGLTGLMSRAEVERLCRMELLRAQRHALPLSLLVIDLDNFKSVNDRWGHPVGDAVLVAAAQTLREAVRVSDMVGRMGGEEFMVLLPHSDAAAAHTLAEKLRQRLAMMVVKAGPDWVSVTASVGVASAPAGAEASFDSLYLRADRALYRAKSAGRDRVEIA